MRAKTYEVKNIIPTREVMRQTMPAAFASHVEVREKMNGTWRIFYPDPAWIPCDPRCEVKHKHDREMNWIESNYQPVDYEDALDWADVLAEGREVKTVSFVPLSQRRKRNRDLTSVE